MMRNRFAKIAVLGLYSSIFITGTAGAENWPGWRGPRGDGTSRETSLPTEWDGTTGKNIVWKHELPGSGHSSPIVWEDRIFLVACDEASQDRLLVALSRTTGEELWRKTVLKSPLERKHGLNSYASGTPVTDGKHVFVTFLAADFGSQTDRTPGDMVVAAYDLDGNAIWSVKPGRFASMHGYCSSPVLFEDKVIINGDHDGDAYIVALNRDTGEVQWKVDRPNKTRSYVTPIIRHFGDRPQMILSGSKSITSYDPTNGQLQWVYDGPTEQFVASVVDNGELIFVTAGFPEHHILAMKPTGSGKIDESHVVWRTTKYCSYVPSPVIVGDYFVIAADNGVASCYRATSGDLMWVERLGRQFSASLVAAHGLVYFLDDDGVTKVVKPGESLEVVAENQLGEPCFASPAISQGQIFVRGTKHLYCIGNSEK